MIKESRSEYIGKCLDLWFDQTLYGTKRQIHSKVNKAFWIIRVLIICSYQLEFMDSVAVRVLLRVNIKMKRAAVVI